MYDPDNHSVRAGNMFTLTLTTPAPEHDGKEPGDYNGLLNKPKINNVELMGNMRWQDFGIPDLSQLPDDLSKIPSESLSNNDLDEIINS